MADTGTTPHGQSEDSPTLYATLMDDALGSDLRAVEKGLGKEAAKFAERLNHPIREAIRTAYSQGLIHGFQQGVQAECKRRDGDEANHG